MSSRASVDAVVAGAVDLDDIGVLAGHDRLGEGVVAGGVVEGVGEDAGHGGLADAPGAAEEVGVGDAVLLDGARSVRAMGSCPTTSSKSRERYRRARTV
jgi:hypothetical protein